MKLYGLIGKKLAHSFSAKYFTEKFQTENITQSEYKLFEIHDIHLIHSLIEQNPCLVGFNVTIPYKESIIPLLDDLSPEANAIGAVNCVHIKDGKLVGYNTDAYGFSITLKQLLGDYIPEKALVLGSGGASKAVQYVLGQLGITFEVVSRDSNLNYMTLTSGMVGKAHLIVNCTPLGMYPNSDEKPNIPLDTITNFHYLYDLIYNPDPTCLMNQAQTMGAKTCSGLDMLYAQADKSYIIWTQN